MPRYVILFHDHPFPHWDFLLETSPDAALKSWRLLTKPAAGGVCPAEPLSDHRRVYLDYEGPVSGGRGRVTRWDWGTYETRNATNSPPGAERRCESPLTLTLQGRRGLSTACQCRTETGPAWRFD